MSARRALALAIVASAASALAVERAARADDGLGGPVGWSHNLSLELRTGSLKNDVIGDAQLPGGYQLDGAANFFRIRGGGYLGPTHYGHPIAIEATSAFGWISRDAFIPVDEGGNPIGGAEPTWGRLFLDFDLTMLVEIFRIPPNRWVPPARISWLGGWGINTDFAYFYMGGRLAGRLGPLQGELEYQRRWGESFSAPNLREERFHLFVYYKAFGVGVENWHGYSEDAMGLAATDRVMRGGFNLTTFNLVWVK